MKKTNPVGVLVLVCTLLFPALAAAQSRVALVIGNGAYVRMRPLNNPANDAADVAGALRKVGFRVSLLINANRRDMNQAIVAFREALAADRQNEGVFFYAGHGIQSKGVNYLLPVSADIRAEIDLEDEAISAQKVLGSLDEARNRVNLVVLDACRNNPLPAGARGGGRGLAVIGSAPPETVVLYSTGAGQEAEDGEGQRNSPFTQALLAHLGDPGDITQTIKKVLASVKSATSGRQSPFVYSNLSVEFLLNAGAIASAPVQPAPASVIRQAPESRPTPPILAPASARKTAIWAFLPAGIDPKIGLSISTKIAEGLIAANEYTVIDGRIVEDCLKQIGILAPGVFIDNDSLQRLRTQLKLKAGISYFIRAGLSKIGNDYIVSANLVDVSTGVIVTKGWKETSNGVEAIIDLSLALGNDLAGTQR